MKQGAGNDQVFRTVARNAVGSVKTHSTRHGRREQQAMRVRRRMRVLPTSFFCEPRRETRPVLQETQSTRYGRREEQAMRVRRMRVPTTFCKPRREMRSILQKTQATRHGRCEEQAMRVGRIDRCGLPVFRRIRARGQCNRNPCMKKKRAS